MTPIVACKDLCLHDGRRTVLAHVQFQLGPGVTCIIGRNGTGKTMLLRALAGIVRPAAGQVLVHGFDPGEHPFARQAIGYLSHRPSLHGQLTVEQNLRFWT
ncbi:MAG: ATP-binding cassette domain-containing protein, partial [Burkholderiaceae bacterium]